jgi:hypothetical protein
MYELPVEGEIKTIAFREGSSGIFSGTIEGLYHGYRFGSTTPDEREYTLEAPNGTIALLLRQQIVTPLPPRSEEHPFAGGRDPFEDLAAGRPPAFLKGGGPPPGAGHGGPPGGAPGGGPPGERPGMEGGEEIFKKVHYMEVKLHAVPDKSTGIFEGVTGEVELEPPSYQMGGYLVISTKDGDLRLDFLEKGSRELLNATLWVDGANSTGIYENAKGELTFSLEVTPPFYGRGPYSGTIQLENEPG